MNRACLAVILVAAASPAASAGTYLGLGIGTAPALNDDNGTARHVVPSSRSGKVFAGMRFGQISVEGGIGGFSLLQQDQRPGQTALLPFGSAYQASLSLKGSLPLGSGFEAFGHVGAQHMWITDDKDDSFSASGNGYLLGVGAEYRLNLGIGSGSIFIDYGVGKANLDGARRKGTDVSTRMWTLGLTVGL